MTDLEILKGVNVGLIYKDALSCTADEYALKVVGRRPKDPLDINELSRKSETLETEFNNKRDSNIKKYTPIMKIAGIVAVVSLILMLIFNRGIGDFFEGLFAVAAMAALVLFFLIRQNKKSKWVMPNDIKEGLDYCAKYPELIEEYERKYNFEKERREKIRNLATDFFKNLKEKGTEEEFNNLIELVPAKYRNMNDIPVLIQIIEDGRATNLQQAINIFVADNQHKEMMHQQEMAALRAHAEQERHYKEMEAQAKRQSDEMEKQTKIARENQKKQEQANKALLYCQGCAHNHYCSHLGKPIGQCNTSER